MTNTEKRSLYESIMKDVAKTVKRKINEAGVANFKSVIKDGLDYIQSNEDMKDYYEKADVWDTLPSNKVSTMCTDGKTIYYNPKFINDLTPKEIAFVILHQCVHQIQNHKSGNMEENIELDRKVNRYLENRWPEFNGLTKKLNGFI